MMKSASISPNYRTEAQSRIGGANRFGLSRRVMLLIAFWLLAAAAYCAPWVQGSAASNSLTGYDLAEWSSLVPGVRYGAEPMLVPGLLRVQLMFLALVAALIPPKRGAALWWLGGAVALMLAVVQLPPFEYFLEESWRADVNYGQQVTLALLTLFNTAICLAVPRGWPRKIALGLMAVAAVVTALAGASKALALAAGYAIPAGLGIGVIGYAVAMAGIALVAFIARPRRDKSDAAS